VDVDVDDWDLPASAFRPDPPRADNRPLIGPTTGAPLDGKSASGTPTSVHPCTCGGRPPAPAAGVQIRPVQVNIGIIISAAALLGFSNTQGQLADRSALISADAVRDLAARPGTLFHRLVTDTSGNLLEVNELGRFPSKKLALAVAYRDGVCNADTCHTSAFRCDLDHVIPVPKGPTTAINLKSRCRTITDRKPMRDIRPNAPDHTGQRGRRQPATHMSATTTHYPSKNSQQIPQIPQIPQTQPYTDLQVSWSAVTPARPES